MKKMTGLTPFRGRRWRWWALLAYCCSTAVAQTVSYEYDALGRVTSATHANGTQIEYQYDTAGNRIAYTVVTPTTPGTLKLSAPTFVVGEGGASVSVSVLRVDGSFGAASVNYSTSNGSATAGSDYASTSSSLTWAHGDISPRAIVIPITDDTVYEPSETFALTISGAAGATLGNPAQGIITITENDPFPGGSAQFSSSSYTVFEDVGSATITVSRLNGAVSAASVDYVTSNGTAQAGSDYTSTSGTLTWAAGDSASKIFSVPITNDTAQESAETIQLTLSNAAGVLLGSPSSALIGINDNDGPGYLQFSAASSTISEAGVSITIAVSRVHGSLGAASVSYLTSDGTATAGSDYTVRSGILNWAAGETSNKSFSVPINNDTAIESDETVLLTLSNAAGAVLGTPDAATFTIIDNDGPGTLQFQTATSTVAEGTSSINISVSRSNGSLGAASVQYSTSDGSAIAGSDYTAAAGTLNWAAGETATKSFAVPITNDTATEATETVNLTLSNPTGATLGARSSATLSITDNDQPGSVQFSAATYTIAESGPSVTITVRRVNGSTGAASVNYATSNGTATAGSDYTARSGTLSWTNGNSSNKTFTIPITNDAAVEGSETITVTLSNASGASLGSPSTATVTITDND